MLKGIIQYHAQLQRILLEIEMITGLSQAEILSHFAIMPPTVKEASGILWLARYGEFPPKPEGS